MHLIIGIGVEVVFHDPPMPALAVAFQCENGTRWAVGQRQNGLDFRAVGICQGEIEDFERLRKVSRVARADDTGGNLRLVQHPTGCNGAERYFVPRTDFIQRFQQGLKQIPIAEFVDDQSVLDQGTIGEAEAGISPSIAVQCVLETSQIFLPPLLHGAISR